MRSIRIFEKNISYKRVLKCRMTNRLLKKKERKYIKK